MATQSLPDAKTLEKLATLWTVLIPDESIRTQIIDRKFTKMLILPDGALARFPFEALVVQPDANDPRYLLDIGPATVYAPSASMYYNLKNRKTESNKPHVLTVGNPDYNLNRGTTPPAASLAGRNTTRGPHFDVLEALPGTEEETRLIEESCNNKSIAVTRFNHDQSTEENIRQNVAGKTIVHLACHGRVLEESNYCALELTVVNQNYPNNDGNLELPEMFALDLKSCDLAVLSACVTNIGQQQHGEGTWSMGRGMLASGAKRVVTTNWNVADTSSALLVHFFIGDINESSVPDHAAALRQAKQEIRSGNYKSVNDKPEWRHPYYWAPFVLIGPK